MSNRSNKALPRAWICFAAFRRRRLRMYVRSAWSLQRLRGHVALKRAPKMQLPNFCLFCIGSTARKGNGSQ